MPGRRSRGVCVCVPARVVVLMLPPRRELCLMASRYVTVSPAPAVAATAGAAPKPPAVQILELSVPRSVDMYEFDRVNEEIARVTADDPAGRWVLDMSGAEYVGSAIL